MPSYSPRAGFGSNRSYKSYGHYQAARAARGDVMGTGLTVSVDTRQLKKLQAALRDAGVGYKRSEAILAQSMNRAGQRLRTELKRAIQGWTGIRRQGELTKRMHLVRASPGAMRAGVSVYGRHLRITTADFGAAWKRSWPGGRHSAWNRRQTAKGSFMAFAGRGSSYGGGLLFTRTTRARFPIKPLWGPNPVREMERHAGFCRALVTREARWVVRECARRAEVELLRVKGKYGL
jgi:hypothetical protein